MNTKEKPQATPPPISKDIPTAEDPEIIEPEGESVVTVMPSMGHIDAVILVASKLDEYGRARDAIMNFIIKQSYPGDWVSHSLESVNKLDRTANLGAAGCERIAALLGIKELNWKQPRKEWSDNRLHFTYVTEADFEFHGRRIHVVHRVGTRDKFWRTEYVWDDAQKKKLKVVKPLEDVREDYIEKASFRGARKEGVRTLMGLRNVPLKKLSTLGFNIEEVHYASFKASQKTEQKESGQVVGAKAEDGRKEYTLNIKEISEKKQGKKGTFYWVTDISGDKFLLTGDETSDNVKALQAAANAESKVKVRYDLSGDYRYIREVLEVTA